MLRLAGQSKANLCSLEATRNVCDAYKEPQDLTDRAAEQKKEYNFLANSAERIGEERHAIFFSPLKSSNAMALSSLQNRARASDKWQMDVVRYELLLLQHFWQSITYYSARFWV